MEYQFEIVGRDNPAMVRQLYEVVFKPYAKIVTISFVVLAMVMAFLGWVEQDVAKILTAVVYCFMPSLFRRIPKWIADGAYKDRLKDYQGETPKTTALFGEKLTVEDEDSSYSFFYDKITQIHFTQDAILIQMGKQKMVAIPNREFTKGSLSELKQFLRTKRPDLTIPE